MSDVLLELYAVRNQEGKWFRAKGYGGYGETWVPELSRAKLYAKIGQARSRVSYFAKNHPAYGVPELVALRVNIGSMQVIDESQRVAKVVQRGKEAADRRRIADNKRKIEWAQRDMEAAQNRLKQLRNEATNA